jgi:hypothetical protein
MPSGSISGRSFHSRRIRELFWQCFHLGDALWEDTITGLSEQKVTHFIRGDPDLSKCEAMASTSKHHKRHPRQVTARVHSITATPTGTQATIRWERGSNTGTEDALDLARRCVAAWDRYLQRKGLHSPFEDCLGLRRSAARLDRLVATSRSVIVLPRRQLLTTLNWAASGQLGCEPTSEGGLAGVLRPGQQIGSPASHSV